MKAAVDVAEQHAEMPGGDVTAIFIALIEFAGIVYPDKLEYVNQVLSNCYQVQHAFAPIHMAYPGATSPGPVMTCTLMVCSQC